MLSNSHGDGPLPMIPDISRLYAKDWLHLNGAGYVKVANLLQTLLEKATAVSGPPVAINDVNCSLSSLRIERTKATVAVFGLTTLRKFLK